MALVTDLALKATLLLLVALGAVRLVRRAPAAQRHFVWLLAVAGLLALPLVAAAVPWRLPVLPSFAVSGARPGTAEGRYLAGPGTTGTGAVAPGVAAAVAAAQVPAVRDVSVRVPEPVVVDEVIVLPAPESARLEAAGTGWASLLPLLPAALWLAGLAAVLLRLGAGLLELRRLVSEAREARDPSLTTLLDALSERLSVRAPIQLLLHDEAVMPMTFGLRRPVILLPGDAETWSGERREVVLLHELAHVRRRDLAANLLTQLACAVYWFHPLMWLAASRLRHEAERASDDLVLGAGAPASTYADQLLAMVRAAGARPAPAFALPLAQRSAFEGRVLAILEPDLPREGLRRRTMLAGTMALIAVALPLASLAPASPLRAQGVVRDAAHPELARAISRAVSRATARTTGRDAALAVDRALSSVEPAVWEGRHQDAPADPVAVRALLGALQDSDASVRLEAAQALGNLADTAAISALVQALRRDASVEVRVAAAEALGEIEDPRAVPGLLQALREERDRSVRLAVVRALGEIEHESAVAGIGTALRGEDDPELRRTMVWALGEIESADAVPVLAPLLRDQDVELREKTAWALGEIESAAAVEPLAAALAAERVVSVREQMVWALGEIEDVRAAPALEQALRDTSLTVRRKAVWALGELDGLRAAPPALLAALRDTDAEVRRGAACAIGELEDPAGVPGLVALLRDPDLETRRAAISALAELPGTAAIEALVAAMRDEDPEVRRAAARALGNR